MVCQSCGNPAAEGAFCSRCGAALQAAGAPNPNPAVPPGATPYPTYGVPVVYEHRVQRHVQTLGILWIVYGAYRALGGILAAAILMGLSVPGFFGNWGGMHGSPLPFMGHVPFMGVIGAFVALVALVFSVFSFVVGYALTQRKPWGRILAIVLAILQLIKLPFGTALGIYTLWVLAPSASGVEYDAIADRT